MAKISVSGLQQFVEGFMSQPFWVGIDVHKRTYHVALRRADDKVLTFVSPASPKTVVEQIGRLGIDVASVVYESGPTGFSLARTLESVGIRTLVAAPSKVPRAVTPGAKTDRLDCVKLAEYASKGLIRPIAVPTPEEEAHRSLLRRRHSLIDSVRRCKQRIKGLLLFLGLDEPEELEHWGQGMNEALEALPMQSSARLTMESYLRELTFCQNERRQVEAQLHQLTEEQHRKPMACLRSVPGVGPIVATSFLLEIFRPERFSRAEEVASYLGLAPMVRHSGQKTPSGRLMPVGQTRLRSLLIEAAWMWKAKDAYARELYNRILSRTGLAQKAITALAHKLAIILWRLSIEQRPYRVVATA